MEKPLELIEYQGESRQELAIQQAPNQVLAEAQRAATALKNVISNKARPVVFNGKQYLEFEDWQTVGRFYGTTAKVISTEFVEYGEVKGFLAKAVAYNVGLNQEISAAEAMCLNDEKNWSNKPLFQLRSMAQTRACGKALRNVLAWVVVLAGYAPTPAEEMQEVTNGGHTTHEAKPMEAPKRKAPEANGKKDDKPFWIFKNKEGESLLCAKTGTRLNSDFLTKAGMRASKTKEGIFTCAYSSEIEELLIAKMMDFKDE